MKIHTGVRPHVCKFCNKSFIQATQLRAHMFHHTGENGFPCDRCDQVFNRKSRLDAHIKLAHEKKIEKLETKKIETKFICELCEKTFVRKSEFIRHMNQHNGIKSKYIFFYELTQ